MSMSMKKARRATATSKPGSIWPSGHVSSLPAKASRCKKAEEPQTEGVQAVTDILLAALCYIVPTFPLGWIWHMTIFTERYKALQVYRDDPIPALGLSSMVVQGVIFAVAYVALIEPMTGSWLVKAAVYAGTGGLLSWSFTTLAWAAKARLTSLSEFFALETAFTAVQWIIVGVATALILG